MNIIFLTVKKNISQELKVFAKIFTEMTNSLELILYGSSEALNAVVVLNTQGNFCLREQIFSLFIISMPFFYPY